MKITSNLVPAERSRSLARVRKDVNGVTAVEFALIAPVLLLLIFGIVEVSLIMFAGHILETAAFSAARVGKTGYAESGKSREQTILDALTRKISALLDPTRLSITSRAYDDFSSVSDHEPFVDVNDNGVRDEGENYTDQNGNGQYDQDSGSDGPGSAGEVTVYTISYPWPLFTPMMAELIGTNGVVILSARAVVKNESY